MSTVDPPVQVGFGWTDITPPVGVELQGFGPFLGRSSTSIRDRIRARAVAVDNGSARWVLVSCDLLGLSDHLVDAVTGIVTARAGWSEEAVVVHATHNHSGPATITDMIGWGEPDLCYLAQLPALVARACLDAIADLAPSSLGHGTAPLTAFAHNRMRPPRGLTNALALDAQWTEPQPELVDSAVHVVRVDRNGCLRGFLAYYSCHPVVCCEQTTAVHGDFPGEALGIVEAAFPDATGVFLQGALGDINPTYAHGPHEESMRALAGFGSRFASAIRSGLDDALPLDGDQVAAVRLRPAYDLAPVDVTELRERRGLAAATPDDGNADVVRISLDRTLRTLESGQNVKRPIVVSALVLGPIRLVGFNLEVFHGIKRRVQAMLGDRCLVMSTTHGYLGYAPTRDAYEPDAEPYPAYEMPLIVGHLPFQPGVEDVLVDAALRAHALTERKSMQPPTPIPTPARRPDSTEIWWREAAIYESHLPSLRDGNGDGIGDLYGLVEVLDYLADLGVRAVWVGPFFASPLLDQGFDVSDYTAVEPVFGTIETFDLLVAEAHARDLRIIVDYIPNHTSDQHPWFVASRSSRTDPRRDWYVWRDGKPDGGLPTNWTSEAGGSVWEWDAPTGQYYLHSHLKEQPDLNWRNPEVSAAMLDVLRFWLDRGADGVRIDVAHMLMKDPEFRDNPAAPDGNDNPFDLQHPDFGTQLHVHDRRHPDTHQALAEIRAVVDEYPAAVTIAEIEAMSWEDWAAYYGDDLTGMHLPFPFRLLETPWRADALYDELRALYRAMPPGAWPIVALGNHDRSRLATRLGPDQARVAAVLLLTLAATPCLLYADELGMTDQPVPVERQRDYFARATGGVTRDPARTPMPWNSGPNAGFSTAPEGQLWLPIAGNAAEINVEAQRADPGSFLSLYRRLLALRQSDPALRQGRIAFLCQPGSAEASPSVLAYARRSGDDHTVVALNLCGDEGTVEIGATGTILVSTTPSTMDGPVGPTLLLGPNQAVIIEVKEALSR